jgi:hypothetical protein
MSDEAGGGNRIRFSELLGEESLGPCANCFEEAILFLGTRESAICDENFPNIDIVGDALITKLKTGSLCVVGL